MCGCIVYVFLDLPDLSLIQQEVDALEELSRQLFLETVDLQSTKVTQTHTHTHTHTTGIELDASHQEPMFELSFSISPPLQERIEYSKTFQGKYFNFLGYFFSIYCVWKIFMVRLAPHVGKVSVVQSL